MQPAIWPIAGATQTLVTHGPHYSGFTSTSTIEQWNLLPETIYHMASCRNMSILVPDYLTCMHPGQSAAAQAENTAVYNQQHIHGRLHVHTIQQRHRRHLTCSYGLGRTADILKACTGSSQSYRGSVGDNVWLLALQLGTFMQHSAPENVGARIPQVIKQAHHPQS